MRPPFVPQVVVPGSGPRSRVRGALLVLGLALIAAGGVVYGAPRVQEHLGSSAYCASCHAESTEHLGGHARTRCQSCHPLPEGETVRLVWGMVGGGRSMPEHGSVDETSCKRCHQRNERSWNALTRTEGHWSHALEPEIAKCVRCHSSSLHGQQKASERCQSCHETTVTRREGPGSFECERCHVFGSGRSRRREQTTTAGGGRPWGADITGANVHGAADCRLCHNPHRPEGEEERAQRVDCARCHRGELARSITHAPENHRDCNRCHRPHGPRTELETACAVCHQAPRVRGDVRDPGVPPEMRELASIVPILEARQGPPPPVTGVTHDGRCANCHEPHAWAPSWTACDGCHEEQTAKIARFRPETHSCQGCHEPHSPKPGGDACAQCHGASQAGLRAAPARHRDCLSCHRAHDQRPLAAVVCGASCHQRQQTALREGQPRHRNCANCHAPHANPIARAAQACQNCHGTESSQFAGNRHQSCDRCHSQHQFTRASALARCPTCHRETAAPGAAHPGSCLECHTPHQAGRGRATQCASCHAEVRPAVNAHANNCAGCHRPHRPKADARAQCTSCHGEQARAAAQWRSDTPHGGTRCPECHTEHAENRPRECRSCHERQASQAHTGVHRECKGCHAPHEAPARGTPGWWGRCGSCHTAQARLAATGRPEHQACANCHSNPGRQPRACPTCHTNVQQIGGHQHARHRDCTSCHATHGTTPPGRTPCLSCHTEQRTHFPDAPRCQTCHPFARE